MPELSRFLGIVIYMYFRDHAPAHFHAEYGEFEIIVDIATGEVRGKFPPRAQRLVLEWYALHRSQLLENWSRALRKEPLIRIDPLE